MTAIESISEDQAKQILDFLVKRICSDAHCYINSNGICIAWPQKTSSFIYYDSLAVFYGKHALTLQMSFLGNLQKMFDISRSGEDIFIWAPVYYDGTLNIVYESVKTILLPKNSTLEQILIEFDLQRNKQDD